MKNALIAFAFAGLAMAACGSGVEKVNEAGNAAFAEQDCETAMRQYQAAAEAVMANVFYRQENFEQAEQSLESAMLGADEALTQKSRFNLGNTRYRSEDYEGAVEAYKEALRLDPNDMDAKVNLELALNQLQQEQEEQPAEQKQPMPYMAALMAAKQ